MSVYSDLIFIKRTMDNCGASEGIIVDFDNLTIKYKGKRAYIKPFAIAIQDSPTLSAVLTTLENMDKEVLNDEKLHLKKHFQ